jgi:hypothetical protein
MGIEQLAAVLPAGELFALPAIEQFLLLVAAGADLATPLADAFLFAVLRRTPETRHPQRRTGAAIDPAGRQFGMAMVFNWRHSDLPIP